MCDVYFLLFGGPAERRIAALNEYLDAAAVFLVLEEADIGQDVPARGLAV
jgi:hypothetical protein